MRTHHNVVVIGGGTAGITVAARLHRAGIDDVAVVEPSEVHYYQPLWTLVGGGRAKARSTVRPMAHVMPKKSTWIHDAAAAADPTSNLLTLASGDEIEYESLVVAPGIQLDWDRLPGSLDAMHGGRASSNYTYVTAQRTWELVRNLRGGTAVFTMPSGPIKCGGAPQKIAYLAADYWRREGRLGDIKVVLVLPSPKLFAVPVFNAELERIVDRYGIDVRLRSEVTEINPDSHEVVISDLEGGTKESLDYDFAHLVPPQSAPDWIKKSPLSDPTDSNGYIAVDKHTMQHSTFSNVFALGDAAGSPNSKTGAAIRKQAPVVVENLLASRAGEHLDGSYDGYSSCPIVTGRNRMLLCEFDYSGEPHPTIPFIDTTHERYDMWLLKKYGLPALYWNLMLRGLV